MLWRRKDMSSARTCICIRACKSRFKITQGDTPHHTTPRKHKHKHNPRPHAYTHQQPSRFSKPGEQGQKATG